MSPRKLTADDKEQILELYRLPQETTSTLADRFKVSSSTISRFLKSRLNEGEYEDLIQQKRLSRTPSGAAQVLSEFQSQSGKSVTEIPAVETAPTESVTESSPEKAAATAKTAKKAAPKKAKPKKAAPSGVEVSGDTIIPEPDSTVTQSVVEQAGEGAETPARSPEPATSEAHKPIPTRRRAASSRRRSSAPPPTKQLELAVSTEEPESASDESEVSETRDESEAKETPTVKPRAASRFPIRKAVAPPPDLDEEDEDEAVDVHALEEMLGEDIGGDEEEEDWGDEEDDDTELNTATTQLADVQVLPLSAAHFPQTCYLVIDRAAELITHPLQDFHDLGHIPGAEVGQTTLPVFDNHRVARRFSKRTQRVIKVPDTQVFVKTQSYLQARGITRLLLDGKVYSL